MSLSKKSRNFFGTCTNDGDLARLDAAMTFLDALCARNIRRRPSQGGRPPKAILMLLASSGCKLGLIAFDREEIMALGVADVAANLALRENRVASDGRSSRGNPFKSVIAAVISLTFGATTGRRSPLKAWSRRRIEHAKACRRAAGCCATFCPS